MIGELTGCGGGSAALLAYAADISLGPFTLIRGISIFDSLLSNMHYQIARNKRLDDIYLNWRTKKHQLNATIKALL